eukprot:scaffold476467_cov46-Prasinocladus_malaysianus.AAC.1
MAPEVLKGEKYNEKVDVFSASIIIWEIFNYRLRMFRDPKEGLTTPEYLDKVKQNAYDTAYQCIYKHIASSAQGKRPYIPSFWPSKLGHILERGWSSDPDRRPSCEDMVNVFKSLE